MRQLSGMLAAAAALVLLLPAAGAAQVNSVRGPVNAPVRLEIKDKAPAPAADKAKEAGRSKFPNIDTAKNRQDYDMGTDENDGIRLGRDEKSGDTVMIARPPKKKPQADPYANPPVEVRPIIIPGQ